MKNAVLWIWLAEAIGQGSSLFGKCHRMGYSVNDLYLGDEAFLSALFPRKTAAFSRLLDKSLESAQGILEKCQSLGVQILHAASPDYPAAFWTLENPPPVLYMKGCLSPKDFGVCVGVVGTRHPTDYGSQMAYTLACSLAKSGVTVVSGLALGIDTLAHAGALAVGGKTVAVLASGVDKITPARHKEIGEHILRQGAILSEYPPGTSPRSYHFPCRNRLVAALSSALAVLEGGVESGAMITAKCAMALGKPIYALPGRLGEAQAEGPMHLLSLGANLILGENTISRALEKDISSLEKPSPRECMTMSEAKEYFGLLETKPQKKTEKAETPPSPIPQKERKEVDLSFLSVAERQLYFAIPEEGTCLPDDLLFEDLTAVQVMRYLTNLEMEGLIQRHAGGRISRT